MPMDGGVFVEAVGHVDHHALAFPEPENGARQLSVDQKCLGVAPRDVDRMPLEHEIVRTCVGRSCNRTRQPDGDRDRQ